MKTYKTAEVADSIGIHSNTVRLYEKLGLITKPDRLSNGYRIFTDLHIEQFKLARTAFQIEILQNDLRKKAICIIKSSAAKNFEEAIKLTDEYLYQIKQEQKHAKEVIEIVKDLVHGKQENEELFLKRKETAEYLEVSMDTLRNWELNGLLTIKRKENGYRIYTSEDIKRLKIIRSLRLANYSLNAILRLLHALDYNPNVDIKEVIDTPEDEEDIISVCDKLLTSLHNAYNNAIKMKKQLTMMKTQFNNPPL